MRLPQLYHWSPISRRETIRVDGLKPYQPASADADEENNWAMGCGVVCLGFTPSAAWGLSGAMDRFATEDVEWDLWQVNLDDNDEVHVRSEFGPQLQEVRVANAIPADRIWWVGTRG